MFQVDRQMVTSRKMVSVWVKHYIISDELVAFCVDSGIHILDRCINDGDGETESAECISDAMDVSLVSKLS